MKNLIPRLVALAGLVTVPLGAQDNFKTTNQTAQIAQIAKAMAPSLVRVEYMLQYDKGQLPRGISWGERCPNCGQIHGSNLDEYVKDERPLETVGFLLSPTRVVTEDIETHPRFIKSIAVRFGDQLIPAKMHSYVKDNNAVMLELTEPLKEARPMVFNPEAKAPYFVVTYISQNGHWQVSAKSFPGMVTTSEHYPPFISAPPACAIVDGAGQPVGISIKGELPVDSSWKGSPMQWEAISETEMQSQLAGLEKLSAQSLMRVGLSLRSPKTSLLARYQPEPDQEENKTERNVIGVLVGETKILVLGSLKPKTTARLQRILVYPHEGEPIPAKFLCTLKDYGAFIATLDKPLPGVLKLSSEHPLAMRNKLLLSADVDLQGEKRVAYQQHHRIPAFRMGWRKQLYPEIAGDVTDLFVFDEPGSLAALPVVRREKGAIGKDEERMPPLLTPAVYLKQLVENPTQYADQSNLPLSEEEENRLAWLGVELQSLNKELARANNVSDQTQDGETGAMVTYVYPNSPASKAGIEPGFILLRLRLADRPNPLEVKLEDDRMYQEAFPWDRLDQVPHQYFDRIPTPWPPAENNFTRLLTDAGFGTKYRAEFFANGQTIRKDLEVVPSPPHFDSAARSKNEALGLTVRNLTFEVRRYFQKKDDEQGVIVSKIEPGSKAAVAGIKPYEIITHINNQPLANVKDFEMLVADQEELNLAIKRMTKGRLVKVRMAAASENAGPQKKLDEQK